MAFHACGCGRWLIIFLLRRDADIGMRCIRLLAAGTVVLCALPVAGDEKRSNDRGALIALENEWLKNEHNAAELEHILAADFLHPVVIGDVLTKAQHIKFSSTHLPPPDLTKHFEGLHGSNETNPN